ncbi:hypothetical protein GLYMA_08G223100v4 [Glycine max]|uniref:Uncharacterized protein n=1 Tax=Glycine max TaxID=3847 RepID=K7L851_SOYBN|nr:hypothetical protein GYH30_022050 [Glycine max]KRH44643.1 hypothetical protein GLYMA_08G223100v4 [Glycine max]
MQWHHIHTFGYVILVGHAYLGSRCWFLDYFHRRLDLMHGSKFCYNCVLYVIYFLFTLALGMLFKQILASILQL